MSTNDATTSLPTVETARNTHSLVVRLRGVGKRFRRFTADSQPFLMRNLIRRALGRRQRTEEFWPLRHVDLDVHAGEKVAILGQNGAGKTTLLSLIAGVLAPTEGIVSRRGRIAALLSLGIGFHPDMTGRECIRFSSLLLGIDSREIESLIPGILTFAELENFADTPTRTYSSGMRARLGFAIATTVNPDLFLIDEVLAVGDHAFRRKCNDRIEALRSRGTTVLLVSHSIEAVAVLCERAIWVNGGGIALDGPTKEVARAYIAAQERRVADQKK